MKKETVEEYLARGGKIEKLPYIDGSIPEPVRVNNGNSSIISMDDCGLYNGEIKKRKKSEKAEVKVDTNKLPADLVKSLKDLGVKFS